MSGLAKLSDKMKKKLTFGDYTLASPLSEPAPQLVPQPVAHPVVQEIAAPIPEPLVEKTIVEKPFVAARKLYSLSKEDGQMLHELFKTRLAQNHLTSISQIMSEAIHLLHQQEQQIRVRGAE